MKSIENAKSRGAADSYYRRPAEPHVLAGTLRVVVAEGSLEWLAGHEALLADAIVQDLRFGGMWRASAVVADLLRGFAKEREQTQARAEQ